MEFQVFNFTFEALQENKTFKEVAHKIHMGVVGPTVNRAAVLRSNGIQVLWKNYVSLL